MTFIEGATTAHKVALSSKITKMSVSLPTLPHKLDKLMLPGQGWPEANQIRYIDRIALG